MGKRAANKEVKSPKKAKVAPAQEAPVLAAIDALSIPAPAREMLKIAIPYCLADREKHAFQVEVLDSIQRLFQGVDEEKLAHASELEATLAEAQADKVKKDAAISAKKEEIASKKQECDEKSKLVDDAAEAVEASRKALEEAKQGAEEFDAKKLAMTKAKENLEKLVKESWPQLKDGAFASTEWRKRNKAISELRQGFISAQIQMEESLLDALEATFKIKPDQRDAFANLTLEFAEDAFKKQEEKIEKDISALAEEGAGHKTAIEGAFIALKSMEKAKEVVEGESEALQNMWVELENTTLKMTAEAKRHDISLEEAGKVLASAKEDLQEFRDVTSLFASLINPPAEPDPVVEPAPAPEDVSCLEEEATKSAEEAPVSA
jgi:hypothetical protein